MRDAAETAAGPWAQFEAALGGAWRSLALLGLGLAAAAYALALISQYGFGLAPCELCLWQRWPYVAGLVLGGVAVVARSRLARRTALAGAALAFVAGVGLGVFHTGVEFGWWLGLPSCGGAPAQDASLEAFLARVAENPPARCDARTPFFLGLTMANWNVGVSLGVAALLGLAWRRV